ncbi:MAG: cysteine desulfurase-like protein [Planctomycetaceae bacterium]|nr:cysteine desulfurase-like protein [Planctomycetaceae bacterium]
MSQSALFWPIHSIRKQFAGLQRLQDHLSVAFFDGPAGSQVPECVVDAVASYLRHTNCNRAAAFSTAIESDAILEAAHVALADFVGANDPGCISFGANMTSLTLALSRAISRQWKAGDEIIVTRLDHDANVTPWVLAARDAGVTVHHVELRADQATLDFDDYQKKLSSRTKLVAIGLASNATGTVNPVAQMAKLARDAGALVFVDAVHYAPHGRINVTELGCDFLACSAYKFFGPHVGVLWGRRELLESIRPYKLRPSPDSLPGKWMTGTQCHEGIAGAAAAVNYLASLDDLLDDNAGHSDQSRSAKLDRVFSRIMEYERTLTLAFLSGLRDVPGIRIWGITSIDQIDQRVPTFSMTFPNTNPRQAAEWLARRGLYVWNGNHYALPFTESVGLEPGGTLRAGALHYNTVEEIQRLCDALKKMQTSPTVA